MTIPSSHPAIRPSLELDHRRRAAFLLVVQNRRQGCGLSRSAIAEFTGLTRQAVTDIETGTKLPTLAVLFALADVLGTDAAELLHETRVLAEDMVFHRIEAPGPDVVNHAHTVLHPHASPAPTTDRAPLRPARPAGRGRSAGLAGVAAIGGKRCATTATRTRHGCPPGAGPGAQL